MRMKKFSIFILSLLFIIVFVALPSKTVLASAIDGSISGFAWSNQIGWINFITTRGSTRITDSLLTGYGWNENVGWINLNPTGGGVINDSNGNLSGSAWSNGTGFINFSGVTVNSSGIFSGTAIGDNSVSINFGCSSCSVTTDWRPISSRGTGGVSGVGSVGIGSSIINVIKASVLINNGAPYTNNKSVNLSLNQNQAVEKMAISNSPDFKNIAQEDYKENISWILSEGDGQKTVYVKFYDKNGNASPIFSANITLNPKAPDIEITKPGILEKIRELLNPLAPNFIENKEKEEELEAGLIIPEITPISFSGAFRYISTSSLLNFVLAPLPNDIKLLAEKFKKIEKTLNQFGIKKFTDILKLKNSKLSLPNLTEITSTESQIERFKSSYPKSFPVEGLSLLAINKIPTDIVFVKSSNGLIDLNVGLDLNDQGRVEQKIKTVSGSNLQLIVRPDKPVKKVTGYIVFKSKKYSQASFDFILKNMTAASILSNIKLISAINPNKIEGNKNFTEERLILSEFEYKNVKEDIYTAEIIAPDMNGQFEIVTKIEYQNELIDSKEMKLIMIVDPEGYIYKRSGTLETRISEANVSIYFLNPETNKFEIWPAVGYNQENPQKTDINGTYSFLVPAGNYYLKVEAPGYLSYKSELIESKEGSGIHINIEMKEKYWILNVFDWKYLVDTFFGGK